MMDMKVKDDVNAALAEGRPVVALESTIISHGLPYPDNLKTAQMLEDAVRDAGATPATIAIINGRINIGLSADDLHLLATPDQGVLKVSRRDVPRAIMTKAHGATTVAATMILAERAGIDVFATGGIGGVHRGAENNFDISADLEELAETSVAVVCAGPKAILDLPLTLEYLETKGVPVIGYQQDEMPAFWSRQSGCMLHERYDTSLDIARFIITKNACGLKGGVLITNPIPEADEIPFEEVSGYIDDALAACAEKGISGKDITPFMLDHIRHITDGRSLSANVALVVNNARLAAQIAADICRFK